MTLINSWRRRHGSARTVSLGRVRAVRAESDRGVVKPLRADRGPQPGSLPGAEMRLAVSRCVALETSHGWRITKEKVSHTRLLAKQARRDEAP